MFSCEISAKEAISDNAVVATVVVPWFPGEPDWGAPAGLPDGPSGPFGAIATWRHPGPTARLPDVVSDPQPPDPPCPPAPGCPFEPFGPGEPGVDVHVTAPTDGASKSRTVQSPESPPFPPAPPMPASPPRPPCPPGTP